MRVLPFFRIKLVIFFHLIMYDFRVIVCDIFVDDLDFVLREELLNVSQLLRTAIHPQQIHTTILIQLRLHY